MGNAGLTIWQDFEVTQINHSFHLSYWSPGSEDEELLIMISWYDKPWLHDILAFPLSLQYLVFVYFGHSVRGDGCPVVWREFKSTRLFLGFGSLRDLFSLVHLLQTHQRGKKGTSLEGPGLLVVLISCNLFRPFDLSPSWHLPDRKFLTLPFS